METSIRGQVIGMSESGGEYELRLSLWKGAGDSLRPFIEKLRAWEFENGKRRQIEIRLAVWRKPRTLKQNAFFHLVVGKIAHHPDVVTEDEIVKRGILDVYAPESARLISPITKRQVCKPSHLFTEIEMAVVIEGAIATAAEHGIDIMEGYRRWQEWRAKQGVDPLEGTYRDKDEYRKRHPVCEASGKFLWVTGGDGRRIYVGEVAHIRSRGSGGEDADWNWLALHPEVHRTVTGAQHLTGWGAFVTRYAHLRGKVRAAMRRHGQGESA